MSFALTELQESLRDLVSDYIGARAPLAGSLRWDEPADPAVWEGMCSELGLALLDVPEELGGLGLSVVELAVVLEAAGAELYSGPLLTSTGLAAGLLAAAGPAGGQLLARLGEGAVVAAAVADGGGWRDLASVRSTASDHVSHWRITGSKSLVLQVEAAEVLLVAAQVPGGGLGLFSVELPGGDGVALVPSQGIDPSRPFSTVTLTDAPASLVLEDAADVIEYAALRAAVALAAESVGAARSCLAMAAEHARTREQFGRPIGAFQGVKHRLADVLVEVELATSAVYLAACHLAEGDRIAAATSVSMAQVTAVDALAAASAAAVQVHGGIGFTWESPCHRFVRRARANQAMLGGRSRHLATIYADAAAVAAF